MSRKCPHEDDILYGKTLGHLALPRNFRVVQIFCATCGAMGTMLEEQGPDNEWYENSEIWHEPLDYGTTAEQWAHRVYDYVRPILNGD